jgi:dTDP-4-amino-4,6-dideoxygalactose transaminase
MNMSAGYEDAAHALGAKYKGKRIGALSEMTDFSFHPVKTHHYR